MCVCQVLVRVYSFPSELLYSTSIKQHQMKIIPMYKAIVNALSKIASLGWVGRLNLCSLQVYFVDL